MSSYWSGSHSSGTTPRQDHEYRPPLPPRHPSSTGGAPGASAPPPLPPRPAGFGYQPVRHDTPTTSSAQSSPSVGYTTNSPTATGPSTGNYSSYRSSQSYGSTNAPDVGNLFPDGKIPPPPSAPPPLSFANERRSTPYGPGIGSPQGQNVAPGTEDLQSTTTSDPAWSEQPSRSRPYGPGLANAEYTADDSQNGLGAQGRRGWASTAPSPMTADFRHSSRSTPYGPGVNAQPSHQTSGAYSAHAGRERVEAMNESFQSLRVDDRVPGEKRAATPRTQTQTGTRPPPPTCESAPSSPVASSPQPPRPSVNTQEASPQASARHTGSDDSIHTGQPPTRPPKTQPYRTADQKYSSWNTPSSPETHHDMPQQWHQSQAESPKVPTSNPTPSQPTQKAQFGTDTRTLTQCVQTAIPFAATWYAHPRVPTFDICNFCYNKYVRDTRFAAEFDEIYRNDGMRRTCDFSSRRITEDIFPAALRTGLLADFISHMNRRTNILNCPGKGGVKGTAGIKWYRPKNNAIPPMVVCHACYEDNILVYRRFGEAHFEPSAIIHSADDVWSCDLASPYILREYRLRAQANDWPTFVKEATSRLNITQQCPGAETVYPGGKRWFRPKTGPSDFLICIACFCDYFCSTVDEDRWMACGDNMASTYGSSLRCCLGTINMKTLGWRTLETEDYGSFWRAIDVCRREPMCVIKGMVGATWYTLHSEPANFDICRQCYVTMVEPMGISHHFKRKPAYPAGTRVTCNFNPGISRFGSYMSKMMEMAYTQDARPLDEFVRTYASMPTCKRDRHVRQSRWYGWNECTVCVECWHEFARDTPLAASMPHHGTFEAGPVMCELYSPRMRKIYMASCRTDPPDAALFLQESLRRRAIYVETMPRAREILENEEVKMLKWESAANYAMANTSMGNMWADTVGSGYYAYGNDYVGYGFSNHLQVSGAEYGRQAAAMQSNMGGLPLLEAERLEKRWRAVE